MPITVAEISMSLDDVVTGPAPSAGQDRRS